MTQKETEHIKEKYLSDIEYIKERYLNDIALKEKEYQMALNESKHQNELLLMKNQLLESELSHLTKMTEISQVAKAKTKKPK